MQAMNNQQTSPHQNELVEYRVGTPIAAEGASQLRAPQQPALLHFLERIAVALESLIPFNPLPVPRPRGGGADILPGLGREDRTALKDLEGDLSLVKADLAQIKESLSADCGEAMKEAPVRPEYLAKEDAAKFLGVPEKTIQHLITTRKLRYVQVGSQRGRVISVEELRRFAQENTTKTAAELLAKRRRR